MTYSGIARPEQLSMLGKVLGDYFRRTGIESNSPEAEKAATVVFSCFENGLETEEALSLALDSLGHRRV